MNTARGIDRDKLINITRAILSRAGFDVSSTLSLRGICFDVIARLGKKVLVVKVLSNIDAFSKENSEEIKILADALQAIPIVIGEHSSSGALDPGIVYSRFNIPIISNRTLSDLLFEDIPPFIFTAPGGLYVKLDSNLLKSIRENSGISLGTLAEIAGVSRRTIQMYESGMGAMIDAALRIEEYLDIPIIEPIDLFTFRNKERATEYHTNEFIDIFALNQLSNLGFIVRSVFKSPFEAVTYNNDTPMLISIGPDDEKVIQRVTVASELSSILDHFSVLIVERKHERNNIDTTVVVSTDELKNIEEPHELTDLVVSRGTKR